MTNLLLMLKSWSAQLLELIPQSLWLQLSVILAVSLFLGLLFGIGMRFFCQVDESVMRPWLFWPLVVVCSIAFWVMAQINCIVFLGVIFFSIIGVLGFKTEWLSELFQLLFFAWIGLILLFIVLMPLNIGVINTGVAIFCLVIYTVEMVLCCFLMIISKILPR